MKKFYLLLLLCASCLLSNAVPAYPGLINITQSDGSTISFYLHGDEYFSYKTTEDGYLIAANADGVMEYAYLGEDNSFRTYGVKAHNLLERSVSEQSFVASLPKSDSMLPVMQSVHQLRKPADVTGVKGFPTTGEHRGLIILVSYTDVAFTTPKANFDSLANEHNYSANGGTGSIRDYFLESSFGQFSPHFDVYGPYTLPHNRAYYGAHSGGSNDARAGEMILDACGAAASDVDFSLYDNNDDGTVDNIFVFYAGNNEADGGPDETIWPHRSKVSTQTKYNGKSISDYACTSEFKGRNSAMCGIGTFCHEFGHVLGLPDFYDIYYKDGLDAMGRWDIMTQGSRNNSECTPPTYTAFERYYLNWLNPTVLVNDSTVNCEGSYTLKSLISSNTAYLVSKTSSANPREFFMIEYRLMEGRDTKTGLDDGVLITHINYNGGKWGSNGPNIDANNLGYYPVLPNREYVYNDYRDLYPYVSDYCYFTMHGEEDAMKRMLQNIEDLDTACRFDYLSLNEAIKLQVHDVEANLAPIETKFVVDGTNVGEDLKVTFAELAEFRLRRHTAAGSTSYSTYINLSPDSNGVVHDTVDVKYTPMSVTYDEYKNNRFIVTGTETGYLTKIMKFRYRNRRTVYVTAPEAYDAKSDNSTSALLSWSFVADTAAGVPNIEKYGAKYYLDVYSISNEPQVDTEGFENFPDSINDDWSANFSTYSDSQRKAGQRAARFSTIIDTIFTKEYMSDIEKFSLWIGSMNSEGVFYVDAQNYSTGEWKNVQTINVTATTMQDLVINKMRSGYRRLRFYYAVVTGSLAIDEISVQTGISVNYAAKNLYLRDTTYLVQNLKQDIEYHYTVRATDRDERSATPKYENITDCSNEVLFKTSNNQPISEDSKLTLSVIQQGGTNYYVVYISELMGDEYKLFVYNLDGVLAAKLPATTNAVVIPQLPVGQYVIKYTKESKGSKSDPVTKFNYNLK